MGSVTIIGDAIVDTIVPIHNIYPGNAYNRKLLTLCGGTANVAIEISKFNEKINFIDKVGSDVFGDHFKDNLNTNGINGLIFSDDKMPTGLCTSLVYEDGERCMIADRGANDHLTKEEIDIHLQDILNSKIVYFSGYSLLSPKTSRSVLHAMKSCHQNNCEIWFNPGSPNLIDKSFTEIIKKYVNVLILNRDEAIKLSNREKTDGIFDELNEIAEIIVITMGKEGCCVSSGDKHIEIPCENLGNVSDTTGAGDAFSAGFIVGRLRGMDIVACSKLANETASNYLQEKKELLI